MQFKLHILSEIDYDFFFTKTHFWLDKSMRSPNPKLCVFIFKVIWHIIKIIRSRVKLWDNIIKTNE